MHIETAINNYIKKSKKKFTFEDIKSYLPKETKTPDRIIADILEESSLLFSIENKKNNVTEYLPRNTFFSGSSFLVSPTENEIEEGILIPGHRFVPFYDSELFPGESFDISTKNNEIICTKQIRYKIEDLYEYHSLLGAESIVEHFIADHPKNKELIGDPSNKIRISVFDFKDFYEENSFSDEDLLNFTITDWNEGAFEVTIVRKEQIQEILIQEFAGKFTESLQNIFEEHGQWIEIPEQLALAYLNCDKKYLKQPAMPLDIFIEVSDSVQVKYAENNTILWYPDKEEEKTENATELLKVSNGTTESLDAILEENTPHLSTIEIVAFIKDSLFNEVNDQEPILSRCFPEGKPEFKDKAQEASFYNHFEEIFEEIAENYSKEEPRFAEMRASVLTELENFYIWFDNYKKSPSSVNDNDIAVLKQDTLYVRKILQHLNTEDLIYSDEYEIEQLDNLIFRILTELNENIEKIDSTLE
jgi:hypothetical protein